MISKRKAPVMWAYPASSPIDLWVLLCQSLWITSSLILSGLSVNNQNWGHQWNLWFLATAFICAKQIISQREDMTGRNFSLPRKTVPWRTGLGCVRTINVHRGPKRLLASLLIPIVWLASALFGWNKISKAAPKQIGNGWSSLGWAFPADASKS